MRPGGEFVMKTSTLFTLAATSMIATAASAEYISAVEVGYEVTAADFGGASVTVYVVDVYMKSNDAADTLLNVYNWNTVGSAPTTYFQSFTGTGWTPTNLGGPFDNEALQRADSFVTIGGFAADVRQVPGAGAGTGLDPNFGGSTAAAPGVNAGWYNSSPPNLNGAVMTYDSGVTGTLIGRFSSLGGEFSLAGTTFEATWNQGLGTPGQQAGFTVPAPGAMALLGLAGLAGRRRRGQ
jgi:MYXO-CTERM domain-containing protein